MAHAHPVFKLLDVLHALALVRVADVRFLASVITACAERAGAAASVERRRREPDRVISLE